MKMTMLLPEPYGTEPLVTDRVVVKDPDADLQRYPDLYAAGSEPLDENEMTKYGLAGMSAKLAYRYEGQPYKASLILERTRPRLTAQVLEHDGTGEGVGGFSGGGRNPSGNRDQGGAPVPAVQCQHRIVRAFKFAHQSA